MCPVSVKKLVAGCQQAGPALTSQAGEKTERLLAKLGKPAVVGEIHGHAGQAAGKSGIKVTSGSRLTAICGQDGADFVS